MKISNSLTSNLRFLFGFMRGFMAVLVVLAVIFHLVVPLVNRYTSRQGGKSMQRLAEVTLHFEANMPRVVATNTVVGDVALSNVRGTISVNSSSADAELASLSRWRFFLVELVNLIFPFGVIDLLWRLCRNAERGDVFTESNTQHVRNLGLVILVYQVVACAASYWYVRMVDGFLSQRVVADGVKLNLHWELNFSPFDPNLIATGLLLLALSEVFRQGLALKKENELTV
jgi:Protein of unknown function (DUF2975)